MYENQRYLLKHWASPYLPKDRPHWSDPLGRALTQGMVNKSLLSTWEWKTDWCFEVNTDTTDLDGWEYAREFDDVNWSNKHKAFLNVRRRKWVRVRLKSKSIRSQTEIKIRKGSDLAFRNSVTNSGSNSIVSINGKDNVFSPGGTYKFDTTSAFAIDETAEITDPEYKKFSTTGTDANFPSNTPHILSGMSSLSVDDRRTSRPSIENDNKTDDDNDDGDGKDDREQTPDHKPIVVSYCNRFSLAWSTFGVIGSSGRQCSVWKPELSENEYCLGYLVINERNFPSNKFIVVIKKNGTDPDAIARPAGLELVWKTSLNSGEKFGAFYKPVPPKGYVSLGDVAIHKKEGTRVTLDDFPKLVCVKLEFVNRLAKDRKS